MKVWYHGTSEDAAQRILQEGFKPGTYFARNLADSLHMGGTVLFEVVFDEDPTDYWEVITGYIPPDRILMAYRVRPEILFHDKDLRERLVVSSLAPKGATGCNVCRGRGQIEDYPPFTYWRQNLPCTVCDTCGGRGYVPSRSA